MPNYRYQCIKCEHDFQKLFSSHKKAAEELECPECGAAARRVFTVPNISTQRNSIDKKFADDPPEYREMHYHEKRGEWDKAAKAAEGVSDFAKRKFEQKARNNEEKKDKDN